jgi:transposase
MELSVMEFTQTNIKTPQQSVKRRSIYGVGIDVHKHNLTVAIAEKQLDAIRIVKVQAFPTTDRGYKQFWAFSSKYLPVLFVFEASGVYSTYFHDFLTAENKSSKLNAKIVQLNPRVAKQMHFASTNHNDPVDAKSLAIIAVMGIAKPFHGLAEFESNKIKELTRTSLRYGRDSTRIKNRIKRLLDRAGIYLRGLDLETTWGCYFIEAMAESKGTVNDAIKAVLLNTRVPSRSKQALEKRVLQWGQYQNRHLGPEYRNLLDLLIIQLIFVNNCIDQIEQLLEHLVNSNQQLQKQVGFIASVPGLSVFSALSILSEVQDIRRFPNYRQFLNYAGLAPTLHASGELSRTGHTNRKSNKFLRTTFYKAGVAIATTVKERSDLKDFAGRMLARCGKGKKAYMKIAAKIARMVYSLLKKGEWYNPFSESADIEFPQKREVIDVKIARRKKSFRKMANWIMRKKEYLPADVVARMRKVLKVD